MPGRAQKDSFVGESLEYRGTGLAAGKFSLKVNENDRIQDQLLSCQRSYGSISAGVLQHPEKLSRWSGVRRQAVKEAKVDDFFPRKLHPGSTPVHRDFEQDGDRSALGPVIHLLIDDGSNAQSSFFSHFAFQSLTKRFVAPNFASRQRPKFPAGKLADKQNGTSVVLDPRHDRDFLFWVKSCAPLLRHLRNTIGSSDDWNVDQPAGVNEASRAEAPVRNASVKRINVERNGQCETDFVTSETTDIYPQLWDKDKPQMQVQG